MIELRFNQAHQEKLIFTIKVIASTDSVTIIVIVLDIHNQEESTKDYILVAVIAKVLENQITIVSKVTIRFKTAFFDVASVFLY